MKVIGVMPAYNEATRIGQAIWACLAYVDALVVVDDGSADGTFDAIVGGRRACPERSGAESNGSEVGGEKVVAIRHAINRGQGAALKTGTQAALMLGADIVVHLDADGQHDPSDIPVLIKPIVDGVADVVLGSRFMGVEPQGMPFKRRILMRGIKVFNALALGIPKTLTDPQSGMRALSAAAARAIDFKQDRMAHASEILRLVTRSKWRWREVPVHVRYTSDSLKKGQKSLDALKITWQFIVGAFS